jgi:spore coat protein SA
VDQFVFVSRFLQEEAHQKLSNLKNSVVLYNGASNKVFYPASISEEKKEAGPIILFASRLVPEKGVHVFVAAMRRLHERGVRAEGSIVGASGFGGSKTTEYIRELRRNAPPNVQFHGYCAGQALGDTFRRADIFCLPSIWQDPLPLAVLEAMASGLPVVATHSGGIPEMLAGGGGVLVSRDSVEELTRALEQLVNDAPLRRRMGQDGYASFAKNYTWTAVYENYRQIVDSIQ